MAKNALRFRVKLIIAMFFRKVISFQLNMIANMLTSLNPIQLNR